MKLTDDFLNPDESKVPEVVENRQGAWTNLDKEFMENNHLTMSLYDIASQLQRNPETVKRYIVKVLGNTEVEKQTKKANFEIVKSPIWQEVKKQFSENEQEIFQYLWGNTMAQFKNDVLPSERLQILEVVRIEILINRILIKLRHIDIAVETARDGLEDEKNKGDNKDDNKIAKLEMIIATNYSSHEKTSKEYSELLNRKERSIASVKAGRSDRIKRIEDSKETLQSLFAMLADNVELRTSLGREMAKQKIAMELELKRLSDYHTYADMSVERAILSCDTLGELD